MKIRLSVIALAALTGNILYGQTGTSDSVKTIRLDEVLGLCKQACQFC